MMEQLSMFDYKETMSPLASRLRPESLETFVARSTCWERGSFCASSSTRTRSPP